MPVPPAPSEHQPSRPLAIFLLRNCTALSYFDLLNIHSPSQQITEPSTCPICYTPLITLLPESPALQIALPTCSHIFCAECVSRHVLAGRNSCPLCRTVWFDIPHGATTALSAAQEAEDRVRDLEGIVSMLTEDMEMHGWGNERDVQEIADEDNEDTQMTEDQAVALDQRRRPRSEERSSELSASDSALSERIISGVVSGFMVHERRRHREAIRDEFAGDTPDGSDDGAEVGNGAGRPGDGNADKTGGRDYEYDSGYSTGGDGSDYEYEGGA